MPRFTGILAALALLVSAGCATAPARTPAVTHMPTDQVVEQLASLPAGRHISTGQPDEVTLAAIADAGYVGVIDLRTPGEPRGYDEAATARRLGLRYVSLPVGGPADMTYSNAALLERALAKLDGPVLMHCASGNRVGALLALSASAAGAGDEEAVAIGKEAGLSHSEAAVRFRLQEHARQ